METVLTAFAKTAVVVAVIVLKRHFSPPYCALVQIQELIRPTLVSPNR